MFYRKQVVETFLSRFMLRRESRAIKARLDRYSNYWGKLPVEKLEAVLGNTRLVKEFELAKDGGLLSCSCSQFKNGTPSLVL